MKTLVSAFLAVASLSAFATTASAQYCPPGRFERPAPPPYARIQTPVQRTVPPALAPDLPSAPVQAPAPVEPVPQK